MSVMSLEPQHIARVCKGHVVKSMGKQGSRGLPHVTTQKVRAFFTKGEMALMKGECAAPMDMILC